MELKNIDKEIHKTLLSFEKTKQAKIDAYFYTRLSAKLENDERYAFKSFAMGSLAASLLLILINIFVLTNYDSNTTIVNDSDYITDVEQSLGFDNADYSLTTINYEDE